MYRVACTTAKNLDGAMSYSITKDDPTLQSALQRIAADQVERALASLSDPNPETRDERIHDARKRCKKLRGLIRLVRPGFDGYSRTNAALRDAAKPLSGPREAAVMLGVYDLLAGTAPPDLDRRRLAPLRAALTRARREVPDHEERAAGLRATLEEVLRDIPDWQLQGKDAEILYGGIAKTFGRARKALKKAEKRPDFERMHAWRKRVKYHWYHARLLRRICPDLVKPHRDMADALATVLGDHHDLADFAQRLREPDIPQEAATLIEPLLIDRRVALEARAFDIGRPLLHEPAKALAARWAGWWGLWRAA